MLISPLSTKYAFFIHLANQPLLEQIRMSFISFTKKRYMIGQDGRKPLGSFFGMMFLALAGLVLFFLSTIIFQSSETSLRRTVSGSPALVDISNMPTASNAQTKYPALTDSYLGNKPFSSDLMVQASNKWVDNTAHSVASQSQFNGNVSVFLSDLNWLSLKDGDFTTSITMAIDGISVKSVSNTSPGTLSVNTLDKGSPAVFNIPSVSSKMGQEYAFAIEGKYTTDYLVFELTSFDAATYSNDDNLDLYYDFVSSHTLTNGTLVLNNTYDYNDSKAWNKDDLESAFASAETEVRYSMISIQNQTTENSNFQSYTLTKRSARRRDKIATANGTIEVLEYDYNMRITRYAKSSINPSYKVVYTSGSSNYAMPVTPVFRTSNPDYLNLASLVRNTELYTLYKLESYINVLPLVILIGVYGGLTLLFTAIATIYNFKRFRNKAYSIPQESLNYLLYHPAKVLFPLFQKVRKARFCMVDGYDPATGYNHLGLVLPEDSEGITTREPDVPYGLAPKPTTSKGILGSPTSYNAYA